jgi:hypothetical protein
MGSGWLGLALAAVRALDLVLVFGSGNSLQILAGSAD